MKYTGSATNSNWPGTPPGQQRACAEKERWPVRMRTFHVALGKQRELLQRPPQTILSHSHLLRVTSATAARKGASDSVLQY
jgi:hypothetical protein